MPSLTALRKKYLNNENWNIGFAEGLTPQRLLETGRMPAVRWLRHGFRDRMFADPHILDADADHITLLCEEAPFSGKGMVSRLTVDRRTLRLTDRKVLLALPTHLSYPAIIGDGGSTYVYPENSEAGRIMKYRYDPATDTMESCGVIADGDLTDFTVCRRQVSSRWYAMSTRLRPDSMQGAWLFSSDSPLGPYAPVGSAPVVTSRACSRPGGNFFFIGDNIYRPAQDCTVRYGGALKIMHVKSFEPYAEEEVMAIQPRSFRYYRGTHTLNFGEDFAVTDGYGYLYTLAGLAARLLSPLRPGSRQGNKQKQPQ